ncbi:TPR-like protein [Neolentinus lepideus HHB14362 ss-1]|uniref:TPR-like protein n=1 Tax=Neolentinus lepideus HHB14362 ss-1 TaxID=1314782 RepID=A0A165THT7_9AGAM|nr:TPR-like protein [Neolentinus lepideus HHB14362 ss-1]
MALPMLVGGADCGPVNPLQGLAKRLDQDRGVQQDFFGAGRAGSSSQSFRTQPSAPSRLDEDASRFFSPPAQLTRPSAFDLAALTNSLPSPALQAPIQGHAPAAAWAADFMQQAPAEAKPWEKGKGREMPMEPSAGMGEMQQRPMHWSPPIAGYAMSPMPAFAPMSMQIPQQQQIQQQPNVQVDPSVWDQEFQFRAVPEIADTSASILENATGSQNMSPQEQDELARTAGLLVETLRAEQSPKFQNSEFMGLMKQLRDRKVIVEGNTMVEKDASGSIAGWATEMQEDAKGKGKAREVDSAGQTRWNTRMGTPPISSFLPPEGQFASGVAAALRGNETTTSASEQQGQQDDPNEEYFRLDNEDYMDYWKTHHMGPFTGLTDQAPLGEWDNLQRDWEEFEATASGIKPVANYQFQANNPYMIGDSSRTRNHMMHLDRPQSFYESVLELEAAVQRNPKDAAGWYELGVKQQENEREHSAIQALWHAIELDPTHLPSWLALAISYTNEGIRQRAYGAIKEWVDRNERYKDAVDRHRAEYPETTSSLQSERFGNLIQCLIAMARSDTSGQIDADIQVALAVLLNTNEEFDKAHDCFRTALAVRPDDWLLYNRAGATLANNGRAEEALQFYYRALELNPAYIRARFNLGISCINLRRYEEAAQHILDALVLQDSDSVYDQTGAESKRGITSSALWESLKTTCTHMQRLDLATLCERQDLEAFRTAFQM